MVIQTANIRYLPANLFAATIAKSSQGART
jgi:hypothetical protein